MHRIANVKTYRVYSVDSDLINQYTDINSLNDRARTGHVGLISFADHMVLANS